MRTYAQVITLTSQILEDTGNTNWATTELDALLPMCLEVISDRSPRKVKETVTLTASSREITLSAENKRNFLRLTGKEDDTPSTEYEVDQDPPQYRNAKRFGNTVIMGINTLPSVAASVYLFLAKIHILQKEIGDSTSAGAIKTTAAIGAVSLILKSLGTGTINENSKLTIAGDVTTYTVTATATIVAGEATVSITPALVAQASADAVVTLSVADSTLDTQLENALANLLAGEAAINKASTGHQKILSAISDIDSINTSVGNMTVRIAQGVTDLTAGKVETDKVATIIGSAATQIGSIAARLAQAVTDVSSGRTQAGGIATIIGSATTDLGSVAARITQAVTDIDSGRSETNSLATVIGEAEAAIDKVDVEVLQAVADLDSGRTLITQIDNASAGAKYVNYATAGINNARGYLEEGNGYIREAQTMDSNCNTFVNLGARELTAATEYINKAMANLRVASSTESLAGAYGNLAIRELSIVGGYLNTASGYFRQAQEEISLAASYGALASHEYTAANAYLNQAVGYVRKIDSQLAISRAIINLENWGRRKKQETLAALDRSVGVRQTQVFPRV